MCKNLLSNKQKKKNKNTNMCDANCIPNQQYERKVYCFDTATQQEVSDVSICNGLVTPKPVSECTCSVVNSKCSKSVAWLRENRSQYPGNSFKASSPDEVYQQYIYWCEGKEESKCPPVPGGRTDYTCKQSGGDDNESLGQPGEIREDIGTASCSHKLGQASELSVLSFNLFWWNLFGVRDGGNLTTVMKERGPFDMMGLQECEDLRRILRESGNNCFNGYGGDTVYSAWDPRRYKALSKGKAAVAHDRADEDYGLRYLEWVRLRDDSSGRVVFFANHHGPLPRNTGGKYGGKSVASNIMKQINENSEPTDTIILVGDFNTSPSSETSRELQKSLTLVASVTANFDNADHVYTNYVGLQKDPKIISWPQSLTGSDHDSLQVIFKFS